MYLVVRFDGDPTYWSLQSPEDSQPLVVELVNTKEPRSVAITAPLVGTMLISPRCAGSIAILDKMPIESWVPSGVNAPCTVLYVPTGTGPTTEFPGYMLPEQTNVGDLSQQILAAMKDGGSITTPIGTASKGSGQVRIDGRALAFAVIGLKSPAPEGQ
jgi:hypothetical protein